ESGFAGETATWTYAYDFNENRTSITFPAGNTKLYTWDFRDQMESITRVCGAGQPHVTFSRDGNGNLTHYKDGLGKDTVITYDGYDRVKSVLQPTGTEKRLTYDAQSNCVGMSMWGSPGGSSPTNNELQRATYYYDHRNRQTQIDREDPQSPLTDGTLTPGDHKVSTVTDYDRSSRVVYVIDDDSTWTRRLYDGASRNIQETDPVGNVTELNYDGDDNEVKQVDKDIYPNNTYRSF